jgi:hypothetical protein
MQPHFLTHLRCIVGAQLQLLQARHLQQLPQVIRRAHLWQGAQRQDLQLTHACQVPQAVTGNLLGVWPEGEARQTARQASQLLHLDDECTTQCRF